MRKFLYFTVFITGLATLGVEFSAERLVGATFGTSNLVWASIIGLILVFLAIGYRIGGRWADRSPLPATLYSIIAWSGFSAGIVPLISRPVLRLAADAFDALSVAVLAGSFAAVFVLLAAPVILMGMVSPFALRLSVVDSRMAGRISGDLSFSATAGSFIGTFLPGLLLVPWIGTARTFLLFSAILVLLGVGGLAAFVSWKRALAHSWMLVALLLVLLFGLGGGQKASAGQIYETESAYNYIQVLDKDGFTVLRLNEGQGVHSVYRADILDYRGPWEQVLAAPFFNSAPFSPQQVESIAIVGLAAGTVARQATAVFGPIPIDGFEIDPKIVEVGRRFFDMNMPNLTARVEDGRWGLEHSNRRYTIISVDAYRPPYIPFHLTTREFFTIAHDHLQEDGVLVINVGRSPTDRRLVDDLSATLLSIFPSVHIMDVPESFNSIIYASNQPTEMSNLAANLAILEQSKTIHPLLLESLRRVVTNQQPTPQNGIVFTDDLSPIEWITNSMVLRFVLSDEMQSLPK